MTPEMLGALDAFAAQFRTQLNRSGPLAHEHAVHFCIARGFLEAYQWQPEAIVFEHLVGARRTDIWVAPFDLAIEVKYQRPIPSGKNRPHTQHFGSLLADFNKLAATPTRHRLVVLVDDGRGVSYLQRSGRGLLPLQVGQASELGWESVAQLARTAVTSAAAQGPWIRHRAHLTWRTSIDHWHVFAWEVVPVVAGSELRDAHSSA